MRPSQTAITAAAREGRVQGPVGIVCSAATPGQGTMTYMGYSHSWFYNDDSTYWQDNFSGLVNDVRRIVDAADVDLNTDLNEDLIRIAGTDDFSAPLVLHRRNPAPFVPPNPRLPDGSTLFHPENWPMAHVKTNRAPWDHIALAVLLRAQIRLGEALEINSDGAWEGEWLPARTLVEAVFGPEGAPPRPRNVRLDED